MICTVSTVKDSRTNVERWVARNLGAGADHMFVFLDGAQPDVEHFLRGHPQTTPILTDKDYWQGRRSPNLNVRQVVNANLVNFLLAPFPWAQWLFHLDGDECLHIDKKWLLEAPGTARSVRLAPLEAVSQEHWEGDVTHFKRLLEEDRLSLLVALGLLEKPSNHQYFNGHLRGKSGVRPSLDLSLRVHSVTESGGGPAAQVTGQHLQLLHYESYSGDEFVRKQLAHGRRTRGRFRPRQSLTRSAVHAVVDNPSLTEKGMRHYLGEIYRRRVRDDLAVLDELGYLFRLSDDPRLWPSEPLTSQQRHLLDLLLPRLLATEKTRFRPERGAVDRTALMQGIRDERKLPPALTEPLDACLERVRAADRGGLG